MNLRFYIFVSGVSQGKGGERLVQDFFVFP